MDLDVCVKWDNQNGFWWNETCAIVVEVFGLPGARYITDVTINNMTFWFRDHRDALLFKLCHGHAELHPA
jgi:hypothetical protein